ncbi:CII family transcriptional regulator [Cronobacter sakazakii]|uniref:CII family transcriptional regulator n=1 Tax=Cronobacter sakazakii TaxID=28141 RepID=UPI0035A5C391
MVGCHESKISRTGLALHSIRSVRVWNGSDISPISRAFRHALEGITKEKAPSAGTLEA